jgi:hypothetical protein
MSYFASSILIAVLAASTAAAAEPSAATATLLDGSEVVGTVTEWTADRLTLESPDGPRVLNREELLDVSWDDEVSASGQQATSIQPVQWLQLLDGTRIPISTFVVAGRIAIVQTPLSAKPFRVSVDQVERVDLMPTSSGVDAIWDRIAEQQVTGDVLVVTTRDADALDYLTGVVGDVTDDEVAFTYDGQQIAVKRTKAAALKYYHRGEKAAPPAACLLALSDGSQIAARQVALGDEGTLAVRSASGARFTVALDLVRRADYSAGKLAYLSDLTPESARWTPRVGLPAAAALITNYGLPRQDLSFSGGPLTLSWLDESAHSGRETRTYQKGLALRSGTELVYRVPDGMHRFKAVAGIDPATANQGHVVLQIRAENRVLWEDEIDGAAPPAEIDLDLGAARRLQISVDYGRNLDYGDRLHLIEARVTK